MADLRRACFFFKRQPEDTASIEDSAKGDGVCERDGKEWLVGRHTCLILRRRTNARRSGFLVWIMTGVFNP